MKAHSISTPKFNAHVIRFAPGVFLVHSLFTLVVFGVEVLPGLIEKAVFDRIAGGEGPAVLEPFSLWGLIALFVGVAVARLCAGLGSEWYGWTFRMLAAKVLRRNLLGIILRRPGDQPLSVSSGEAIHRFRTDVDEVGDFPLWLPDQLGKWIAAAIAVAIMARIHLTLTLIIFLPLIAIIGLTRLAWGRIHAYRHAASRAADAATGFIAEAFDAVQAVKVANADPHFVERFAALSEVRRRMALREELFWGLLNSLNDSAVTFGIGMILLFAGSAITAGEFSVGDFALFVSYLWFTIQVPSELGTFYGDYKQQEVAIDRLMELVRPESPEALLTAREDPPAAPREAGTQEERLERLEGINLTYRYPGSGGGIEGIHLELKRGSFTVITGRVGAGKTTLLRVLLGLLPLQEGEIRWNGRGVEDPASFLRPPRVSYTSQTPRLFSESLRANILLGQPEEQANLEKAIYKSVFEADLAGLQNGLDTLVGPRGVRLSGGQVQRAAAARMLARPAELLVIDDLSSALDVETEQALWERLLPGRNGSGREAGGSSPGEAMRVDEPGASPSGSAPAAILAVSHRRAALRRADWIIVMKDGRMEAEGKLEDLLENCSEMQSLWEGVLNQEEVE